MFLRNAKKKASFTIIEAVMVIVLVGVFVTGVAPFLYQVVESLRIITYRQKVAAQAKLTIDWMVRAIREIDLDGSDDPDISVADAAELTFRQVDQVDDVTYELSGSQLLRDSDVLCEDVTSLAFSYKDQDGQELSSLPLNASDRAEVGTIVIDLTLNHQGEEYSLSSWAVLRNVKMVN